MVSISLGCVVRWPQSPGGLVMGTGLPYPFFKPFGALRHDWGLFDLEAKPKFLETLIAG